MDVKIVPTKKITVFGVDKRTVEDLAWCAVTYGINRLFWIDGYLICTEVYEASFEHEMEFKEFPISQVCYAKLPKYVKAYEVEKGMQIPIVNASDMKIFSSLIKAILENEEK